MTNQEIAAEIVRHQLAVFLQPRSAGLGGLEKGLVEDIAKALDAAGAKPWRALLAAEEGTGWNCRHCGTVNARSMVNCPECSAKGKFSSVYEIGHTAASVEPECGCPRCSRRPTY